ncbi:6780_t:CDS:10 [Paraglomus occultum]|uniref:6780_t:CDS:1 n=1 Tax=Paraglomus occultum TaxID=144539 RepID=A0A9N8VJG4_9GLOM|nr:6780_t:CDS:10 [Paraglomus occultum]
MKIIDKLVNLPPGQPFYSFEYFPPKTEEGLANLYDRLKRMSYLNPLFASFTWGAGGSTIERTSEMCAISQSGFGLETCMHLTCTNVNRDIIKEALNDAKDNGIQNILALRGDPPRGQEYWSSCDSGFNYALDLVKFIRREYGDYFCIGVAGYPEGHPDSDDKQQDLRFLKEKVDAGADFIITQMFFDVDIFVKWEKECRKIGITVPIIPGIMPIQGYNSFRRIINLCKVYVPSSILNALEPIKHDDQAVKDYGVQLAITMISTLRQNYSVCGFHLCTLNLEKSVRLILEELGLVPTEEQRIQAFNNRRRSSLFLYGNGIIKEEPDGSVPAARPIIWKNQGADYVGRSEDWDNFPNGRFGSSKSPAFGEVDGYGGTVKIPVPNALAYWNYPTTVADITQLFMDYISGNTPLLPWSEEPLIAETDAIRVKLLQLNQLGFWTISSQPAVNGARSDDPVFGWGPRGGYVYQKAFVECFVNEEMLKNLLEKVKESPWITYYAATCGDEFRTNVKDDSPTAVTWGVFPGKEIVQPTIIEEVSFKTWKEEAFALWTEWEHLYPPGSPSQQLLNHIGNTWWLLNLVHHNYIEPGAIWEIFLGTD